MVLTAWPSIPTSALIAKHDVKGIPMHISYFRYCLVAQAERRDAPRFRAASGSLSAEGANWVNSRRSPSRHTSGEPRHQAQPG